MAHLPPTPQHPPAPSLPVPGPSQPFFPPSPQIALRTPNHGHASPPKPTPNLPPARKPPLTGSSQTPPQQPRTSPSPRPTTRSPSHSQTPVSHWWTPEPTTSVIRLKPILSPNQSFQPLTSNAITTKPPSPATFTPRSQKPTPLVAWQPLLAFPLHLQQPLLHPQQPVVVAPANPTQIGASQWTRLRASAAVLTCPNAITGPTASMAIG